MSRFNYYFRVDMEGNPIPGSNFKSSKKPRKPRIKQFTPQRALCCDEELEPDEGFGVTTRYFVRLDEDLLPISGTLRKWNRRPRHGGLWQEVTGIVCCPIIGINLNPVASSVDVGSDIIFTVTATYASGRVVDVTNLATYETSDNTIMSLVDNVGTGEAAGDVTITASYEGFSLDSEITVTEP